MAFPPSTLPSCPKVVGEIVVIGLVVVIVVVVAEVVVPWKNWREFHSPRRESGPGCPCPLALGHAA